MKFRITMKDPDWDQDAIKDEAENSLTDIKGRLGEDEYEAVLEKREETLREFVSEWLEYGEYVTIEFDTEEKTATVIKK